jgi:hypothetical protein
LEPDVTLRLAGAVLIAAAGLLVAIPAAADETPTPDVPTGATTPAEPPITVPPAPTLPTLTTPAPPASPPPSSAPVPPAPLTTAVPRRTAAPRVSRGTGVRRRPAQSSAADPRTTYYPPCDPCAGPQPVPVLLPPLDDVQMDDPGVAGSVIPVEEAVGVHPAGDGSHDAHGAGLTVPLPLMAGGMLALFAAGGTILAAFRSRPLNGQVSGGAGG